MRLYKSTLTLRSASASQWQADTVFGHLCWNLLRQEGEATLTAFLELYQAGLPPILLSDGFPGAYLPRPLLPRAVPSTDLPKLKRIEHQREAKQAAHAAWLTLDDFNRVRRGEPIERPPTAQEVSNTFRLHVTPKNQIDRLTDTAGGEAGELYDMEEFILPQVTLYWRIEDGYIETVRNFLIDLQATGYGRRKSIGYGQVESFSLEEFSGFVEVPNADGFITLSRFVPAPTDPTDGFWNTTVKYGKLGEEFAVGGNPFKRPLVQLACGSCFHDTPPREWYGQLISGLSARAEVKHYAFAFAVPMRLESRF